VVVAVFVPSVLNSLLCVCVILSPVSVTYSIQTKPLFCYIVGERVDRPILCFQLDIRVEI
jgi:hypothetical protein